MCDNIDKIKDKKDITILEYILTHQEQIKEAIQFIVDIY